MSLIIVSYHPPLHKLKYYASCRVDIECSDHIRNELDKMSKCFENAGDKSRVRVVVSNGFLIYFISVDEYLKIKNMLCSRGYSFGLYSETRAIDEPGYMKQKPVQTICDSDDCKQEKEDEYEDDSVVFVK